MDAWHIWVIAGIILIILEMFTISFVLAGFGVACLAAAAMAALDFGLNAQLAALAVASVICLFGIRPLFQRGIYRFSEQRRVGAHALIGQPGIVVLRVGGRDAPGRVRVGSEEWRAVAASDASAFDPGMTVEITAIDSATLVVQAKS
ncbi:MAG: NfeD family protein [Verrucomicrobiales bacterium]